ncbi:hypothetical protein [Halovivax cerinus]|uniref:Serine aminopeptidase S33 domain-containing protein n=1 Tax=Halovivax cerinus TaxID=1487865 RepID=A0ABD5NTA1_9EURY|nr:hypothetical protein [Halovivax cerinus]
MIRQRRTDESANADEPTGPLTRRGVLRAASVTVAATSIAGVAPAETGSRTAEIEEIDFRDGTPPVSDGPQGRDEVVFHAHGYTQSGNSVGIAETFRSTARDQGYDGTVAAITWDDSGLPGWAEESARDTGPMVADWLDSFRAENPETTIRLLGFSMGGIVTMETVAAIDGSFTVANADMIGSYEYADAPCQGVGYYEAIANSCGGMYNYWSANDGLARLGAGGASCASAETPENYADVDVTDAVGGHLEYQSSPGCVQSILDNYGDDGGGDCGGETETTTEQGFLAWWNGSDTATYSTTTDAPCGIEIELTSPSAVAEFDLFVTYDGREPTRDDYDDRSAGAGSDETVQASLDGATDLGLLVDAEEGWGEYSLTITERGQ